MHYEHHLFISYAHADNLPSADEAKGWVTRFHDCLNSYLSHCVGGEARIWRLTMFLGIAARLVVWSIGHLNKSPTM